MEEDQTTPQKRPLPPSPSTNLTDQQLRAIVHRRQHVPKKGLQNLGNTCFMNSALQCLSATELLTAYFLSDEWKPEVNTSNPLGMEGRIANVYAKLIGNLWYDDGNSSFSPRHFKHIIGERNPMFLGYGQQDSHELLLSLLDGLHEDLNRIIKKEYVECPDFDKDKMTEAEFAKVCRTD
jgi:ubiquitin carboxyl-terminal hydrolase 4/11/15